MQRQISKSLLVRKLLIQILCGCSVNSCSWRNEWFLSKYSTSESCIPAEIQEWSQCISLGWPVPPVTFPPLTAESSRPNCSTSPARTACTAVNPTIEPLLRIIQINPSMANLISRNFQLGEIVKLLKLTRKRASNYSLYSICISYCISEMGITELLEGTIIKSDYEELCNIKCLLKLRSTQCTLLNSPQTMKTPFVEIS